MNTDKLVFGIIGLITLGVFAFIIFTSLGTGTSSANAKDLIGDDPHFKGSEDALVTIVEFSDFECPACQSFATIVSSLVDQYPDQVNVVYRHFPLPIHPMAFSAAKASEAAANQGQFWDYHNELFLNAPDFSDEELVRYAGDLGMNVEQFESDLDSSDVADRVKEDVDYGNSLNVNSTPTFYLVYGDEYEKVNIGSYNDLEARVVAVLAELNGETGSDDGSGSDGAGSDSSGVSDELMDLIEGNPNEGPFNKDSELPLPTEAAAGSAIDDAATAERTEETPSPLEMQVMLDVLNGQNLDVTPSEVKILSTEPITWPDSSLGCPQDDVMYAQVLTPGFKVTVDVGGETLIYHTDETGDQVVLCEN